MNHSAGQLAHLLEELQIAALRGGLRVGPLEDFDQPFDLVVVAQRVDHQQLPRRVAAHPLVAGTGERRHELRRFAGDDVIEQPVVLAGLFRFRIEQLLAEVDLIGELRLACLRRESTLPRPPRPGPAPLAAGTRRRILPAARSLLESWAISPTRPRICCLVFSIVSELTCDDPALMGRALVFEQEERLRAGGTRESV